MTPEEFCAAVQDELARHSNDESWARGARALCEMYRRTDAQRFELIIRQLAAGRDNSAIAEGGRWLLTRWHAARARG